MTKIRAKITYGAGMTEKTEDREMVRDPVTEEDQAFLRSEYEEYSKDPWGHHTAQFIATAREGLAELRPSALSPPRIVIVGELEEWPFPFEQHEVHNDLAWYYWQLIELDRQVRSSLEAGRSECAVIAALTYGKIYREMDIKFEHEKAWETGLKQRQSLQGIREVHNRKRSMERSAEWARWNKAAAAIWERHPDWKVEPVAKRVKKDLSLDASVVTIRKRLKKSGQAS